MTESGAGSPPAAATPFDLRIHFNGAFVFSIATEGNSSDANAKLTGVEIYTPVCEHSSGASINGGATYMLEDYWHCIDPVYPAGHVSAPLTLGQLQKNIGTNTPWVVSNRPMGADWGIAFKLPLPPDDWQCDFLASTSGPSSGSCFSGRDATIIPSAVALEHIVIYKQVTSVELHGACFSTDFSPVKGVTDLYITSEVPYIPTRQHERRAADAMAGMLGLDLVLDSSIGAVTQEAGVFQPKDKMGNCLMSIISGPKPQ
ncbi:hypothetical protein HNQ77_005121 [Silvibacterium bohemicum]|uniref:Uncharacterized protein n=1 Tax=Silvibacterium bohemicum TaxID=1577686 RepID=A0A841K0R2_9BACT|nr:hypothetical protein [Silvibacterium bohemicum]MBB6147136.1 hypothetical protein [Silvibacterium bohemicum]